MNNWDRTAATLLIALVGLPVLSQPASTLRSASEQHPPATTLTPRDATARWFGPTVTPTERGNTRLSCVSRHFCLALTGGPGIDAVTSEPLAYTIWNGSRWATPIPTGLTPPAGGFTALSCATATFCAATSASETTFYRGHRWSPTATLPLPSSDAVYALSCPVIGFCAAIDQEGNAIVFRHGTWSLDSLGVMATSISCTSSHFCVAATPRSNSANAFVASFSRFNGSEWTPVRPLRPGIGDPAGGSMSVSCAAANFCEAGGALDQVWSFNGKRWSAPLQVGPKNPSVGTQNMWCSHGSRCLGWFNQDLDVVSRSRWTPLPWPHGPTGNQSLFPLSCSLDGWCVGLGAAGSYTIHVG